MVLCWWDFQYWTGGWGRLPGSFYTVVGLSIMPCSFISQWANRDVILCWLHILLYACSRETYQCWTQLFNYLLNNSWKICLGEPCPLCFWMTSHRSEEDFLHGAPEKCTLGHSSGLSHHAVCMLGCSFAALPPPFSSTPSADNFDAVTLCCFLLCLSYHFLLVSFVGFLIPHGSPISVGLGVLLFLIFFFLQSFLLGQHSVVDLMPSMACFVFCVLGWPISMPFPEVSTFLRSMYIMTSPPHTPCILILRMYHTRSLLSSHPLYRAGVFYLLSIQIWFNLQVTPWYLWKHTANSAKPFSNPVDCFDFVPELAWKHDP